MLGDFGPGFGSPSQISMVHTTNNEVFSSNKTSVNFLPLAVVTLVFIVIVLVKVIQLLSKRSEKKRPIEPQMHNEDEQPAKPKK
jgi:preprotein translocase subunit SecG